MKVLMVGELPPHKSGIAYHVFNLSKTLISLGVEVVNVNISNSITENVSNIKKTPSKKQIFASLVNLLIRETKYFPLFFYTTIKNFLFRGYRIYYWVDILLKIVKSNNFDLIHVHSMPGAYICDMLRFFGINIPKVLTLHGNDIILLPKIKRYKKPTINSYKNMAAIITVSEELSTITKSNKLLNVFYIPNGVDIDKFYPSIDNHDFLRKYKQDNKIILAPRQFWVKYGYEILIRAAPYILKENPNTKIILTGDPNRDPIYSKRLFELANTLKVFDKLILIGWVPYDDMPKLYSISDVIVFPSLAEAVCLTALEAMAVEKPIIATAVGGFPEIIKDSFNGFIVDIVGKKSKYITAFSIEEEKIKLFAQKINDLLNDEQKRKLMGIRNREIVIKSYSWKSIAERTVNIYKKVLKIK